MKTTMNRLQLSLERTVVMVASRVSTVRGCDQIVVLDEGRIIERGDHSSLLEKKGRYHKLWRRQTVESELEDLE